MWRIAKAVLQCALLFVLVPSALTCQEVEIVSRSEWGSRKGNNNPVTNNPVTHVIVHHTVTPECHTKQDCSAQMRSMQNYHISRGWGDIGYNFVVGGDGRVYEGVGWSRVGAHTYGWNTKSYGIAFVGNYMKTRPSDGMMAAARKLIVCGIKRGYISKDRWVHGGRDAQCTLSPGDVLYDIIKKWPRFKGGPLEGYSC